MAYDFGTDVERAPHHVPGRLPMTVLTGDSVRHVVVATDRSVGGDHAARWARRLATDHGAGLTLVQILDASTDAAQVRRVEDELAGIAAESSARALVVVSDDIARAIVDASQAEGADVLVIGASGMRNRREFLLGNVANRVTHSSTCTTVIVPLGDEAEASLHAMVARDPRRLARAVEILRILARSGLRELLTGTRSEDELALLAPRLRAGLEELGPTFCKLGQILSTRPDLLPPLLIDELAALRSHVAPMPEAEVVEVMEQELGVPWEDVFASIEATPLAAGTIGQVHRATLADGSPRGREGAARQRRRGDRARHGAAAHRRPRRRAREAPHPGDRPADGRRGAVRLPRPRSTSRWRPPTSTAWRSSCTASRASRSHGATTSCPLAGCW